MKSRLYYVLFLLYAGVILFILYLNGVFTQDVGSLSNLVINLGFLAVIGILFIISAVSFGRLNRLTDELEEVTDELQKEYKKSGGKNLWAVCKKQNPFTAERLKEAFDKYCERVERSRTRSGYVQPCDIEEYINEDLLDEAGMTYFNSGISGTLTGLGILGTFLGLSMGLGSFNGNDIFTISDNVGPLLSGMKVAFHTSVYGIFFSLVFNFIYRSIMSDAYEKLEEFLNAFRQCAGPQAAAGEDNTAAMLVYQANMASSLKQLLELMQGNAKEQSYGVERIVNQFVEQMNGVLGVNFQKLGNSIKTTADAQRAYANDSRNLLEAATALVEVNRNTQEMLAKLMERQESFGKELSMQKEALEDACRDMSQEISNQLYTFEQMRREYEK